MTGGGGGGEPMNLERKATDNLLYFLVVPGSFIRAAKEYRKTEEHRENVIEEARHCVGCARVADILPSATAWFFEGIRATGYAYTLTSLLYK